MVNSLSDLKTWKDGKAPEKQESLFSRAKEAARPDMLAPAGAKLSEKEQKRLDMHLHAAARKGDTKAAEELIAKGADVHAKDNMGWTALVYAVLNSHVETAGMLIDNGADVNAKDDSGRTVLMWAARMGKTKSVELLIEKGADVAARDIDGSTALTLALRAGKTKTAEMLRKHVAKE
jgi:ankyrin repeat protein